MTQYGFYFDNSRCTGCRTCEMACKDYKDLSTEYAYRKVYDIEGGNWTAGQDGSYTTDAFAYHVSQACNHCDHPACTAVCPTGAMHKDPDTGLVSVNADVCIGCGYCVMACPYGVPKVNRELGHSTKCDGCQERVAAGKKPICVEACPLRALEFDDMEALMFKHPDMAVSVYPLPTANYTSPNLLIDATDAAKAATAATAHVANLQEVML